MLRSFPDSRSGRHQRLALLIHTLVSMRPKGGARIRVAYRVSARGAVGFLPGTHVEWEAVAGVNVLRFRIYREKNVSSAKERYTYLPPSIEALGVRPVAEVIAYLVREQPPSGGYLLTAPRGATGWWPTPYTAQSRAFKMAYERAWPGRPSQRFSAQSCRKSLASWLWWDRWSKRLIADHGGWSIGRSKNAVDVCFRSSPVIMVLALCNLGREHWRNAVELRAVATRAPPR